VEDAVQRSPDPLGRQLVLDEIFDLSLYRSLRGAASGRLRDVLDELIQTETRHVAFWQDFFGLKDLVALDAGRRLKLALLTGVCRVFGNAAIHVVLEAIEVHGVRKYLRVWERYRDGPLGGAVREVLEDEFKHEDMIVTGEAERRINPETVRNVFLGLNDGLVEILGAVSGFFAAFGASIAVLAAGFTVAVAGALSMAAGAYIGASSEAEVQATEDARRRFLGESVTSVESQATSRARWFPCCPCSSEPAACVPPCSRAGSRSSPCRRSWRSSLAWTCAAASPRTRSSRGSPWR
jgi:vacuolar iron transporter family protein